MVFLIQTFPQVQSWSENKLESLANVFSAKEVIFNKQKAFKVELILHHMH